MARIKVLVGHCLGGGNDVFEGQVIEVTDNEARRKIAMGFAAMADDEPAPASPGIVHFAEGGTPPAATGGEGGL